jgi:hypothetical protein
LVAGFAGVIVTAGLGPTEKTAQTPSIPSQPVAAYCVGTGMKQVCIPVSNGIVSAAPGSTNSQTYCISVVSRSHWAHINGPGGQVTNDPGTTTDPCAVLSGWRAIDGSPYSDSGDVAAEKASSLAWAVGTAPITLTCPTRVDTASSDQNGGPSRA